MISTDLLAYLPASSAILMWAKTRGSAHASLIWSLHSGVPRSGQSDVGCSAAAVLSTTSAGFAFALRRSASSRLFLESYAR